MSRPVAIRRVEIWECRHPAEWRGRYTSGGLDPAEMVRFFVSVSDGRHAGYGECIPTSLFYPPGHIGRSNIDEWAVLLEMAAALPGCDARGLGTLVRDDFDTEDANSIRDALDFAIHDLVGRCLDVPVTVLLGGPRRKEVSGIPVVHTDVPEAMAEKAARLRREWGFTRFKLKPFGEREADLHLLALLRERVGPDARYTMDANGALLHTEPDDAVAYLNALHPLGLECYEDPFRADPATLRYIRGRTRVKIMLDEAARTPAHILDILRERSADRINIHANWAGGFQAGLRKAWLACQGGMSTMIGSTRYLGPGAAAYITMASVLPVDMPCEQEFAEVFGGRSIVTPYAIRDGRWLIPDAPGLGVAPDLAALEPITVRREIIE